MVAVTQAMSGCRIASSTPGSYHLRRVISSPGYPGSSGAEQCTPERTGNSQDAEGRAAAGTCNPLGGRRVTRRSLLHNADIARTLDTIATLMELKDEAYYRVLAYQRAAESVAALGRPVHEVEDLKELPHVGGTTAEVIRDLAEDRTPQVLADLLAEIPSGLVEMTRLPSVGPRTVNTLWRELGVESVEELAGLEEGRIAALKGFGKKSEERILRAAKTYNAKERRMLLDEATALAEHMLGFVRSHPSTVRAEVAGSLRRQKEPIGDLDLVAASTDQRALADAFAGAPFADEVLAHGPTKVFITCGGVEVDLRIVKPEAFGSLLHHFTGGQAHNITLRER